MEGSGHIQALHVMFNHIRIYLSWMRQDLYLQRYVSQTEIADYAELLADHFDIRRHIKFTHEVSKLEYCDEGYWIIEALKNEDSKKVNFTLIMWFVQMDPSLHQECQNLVEWMNLRRRVFILLNGIKISI